MSWVFVYRSSIIIVVVVVYHTLKKGLRRGEGRKRYIMKEKRLKLKEVIKRALRKAA
jgi:hypothetical protein